MLFALFSDLGRWALHIHMPTIPFFKTIIIKMELLSFDVKLVNESNRGFYFLF